MRAAYHSYSVVLCQQFQIGTPTTMTTITNSAHLSSPPHMRAPWKTDCPPLTVAFPNMFPSSVDTAREGSKLRETRRRSPDPGLESGNVYRTKGGAKVLPIVENLCFPDSYALMRACVRLTATKNFLESRESGA